MRRKNLQQLADEDLMTLVDEKDVGAFEMLYDRHAGAAYSLAYRVSGDRRAAEDVSQEAFLSIWRTAARYDAARGSVRSWILTVVRNRAIDALRKGAGEARHLDADDDAAIEARPADDQTDTEAIRRETARDLRGAVSELPADQSKVLKLAYFGGFSQTEIAAMLGEPLGTVKGRMRLGLEKLRGSIAEGPGTAYEASETMEAAR